MNSNIYFTRQESAERLYAALKPLDLSKVQYDKTYPLQFQAGTYYVRGDELSELKSKLIYLDGRDTSTDGHLNKFYEVEAANLFNGSWLNSRAMKLNYESFIPRNTSLYDETSKIIQGFVQSGRLYASAQERSPIQSLSSEDLYALTVLAIEFKFDAPVLKAIEEETKGKEDVRFVISNEGIAGGAASGFKGVPGSSEYLIAFSIGASSLNAMTFAQSIKERVFGIRGVIRHERGHQLMTWTSQDLYKKEGRDAFLNMVATLTGNEDLYQKINAISLKSSDTRSDDLHQWAYYSQEVCDPIHFANFSPRFFKEISKYHHQELESLIKDVESYGKNYLAHWNGSSRFYMWFSLAENVVTYRGFKLDKKKLDKLDQLLGSLAKERGPEQFEMYELFKKWLSASQTSCAHPEVQKAMKARMPEFYHPINF